MDREVIFEAPVGSHLYGTSKPDSDEDYLGVFLPSEEDIIGLFNPVQHLKMSEKKSEGTKNTIGDVDRNYYSLNKFFNLIMRGDTGAVELLFIPDDKVTIKTDAWKLIQQTREVLLSRKNVSSIVGFALAQLKKTTSKAKNLNNTISIIESYDSKEHYSKKLRDLIDTIDLDAGKVTFTNGVVTDYIKAADGTYCIQFGHPMYNLGITVKHFISGLKALQGKYGSRTKGALDTGVDIKSLYHAFRLIQQAKEFLSNGEFRFPCSNKEFLMEIRAGNYPENYEEMIEKEIKTIRDLEIQSNLPASPNKERVNLLYKMMLKTYVL